MNLKKIIQTDEMFQTLSHIWELQNNERYEESLPLIDKALASEAMTESGDPSNAKIHFLYTKAIGLDMCKRPDEALPIFLQLVTDYPGTPEYESSVNVICSKLEARAKDCIRNNPGDPEIPRIFGILERYSAPPYWLIHAVAAQEVADGKKDQAWKRMENLLTLSPNDSDYLRCALSMAKSCDKLQEHGRLKRHVEELLEERPYRLDLATLLNNEALPGPS